MERLNTQSPQHALRGIEARCAGRQGPAGLTRSGEASPPPTAERSGERQPEVRTALSGDLWMIDHNGATVLRCRCLAVSATRMRLCVPAGYGVAVGQRYELGARRPGEHSFSPLHAVATFWVTVVQTQCMTDGDFGRIDVGVAVDQIEPTPSYSLSRSRAANGPVRQTLEGESNAHRKENATGNAASVGRVGRSG